MRAVVIEEPGRAVVVETPQGDVIAVRSIMNMVLGVDLKPRPELFVEDRLHFSPEGYKLLAERVRPFIPKK